MLAENLKLILEKERQIGFEIGFEEGYKRGFEAGYKKGLESGYNEQVALRLLEMDVLSDEQICEVTNLSQEELQALKQNQVHTETKSTP